MDTAINVYQWQKQKRYDIGGNMKVMRKSSQKSARIIALARAIQERIFNPDTVNMSELADCFGLHRGTIMRDLREVQSTMKEADSLYKIMRNATLTDSYRK